MDYVLYPEESVNVAMYSDAGLLDLSIHFNSKVYLNNLASWYKRHARCDGGSSGKCAISGGATDPNKLAAAFVAELGAPKVTCGDVPFAPEPNWWAAEMSHPTFASFVAPLDPLLSRSENSAWLDTFAKLCNTSNLGSYDDEDTSHGIFNLCSRTYFQASQQVISSMVYSGTLQVLSAVSSTGSSPSLGSGPTSVGATSSSAVSQATSSRSGSSPGLDGASTSVGASTGRSSSHAASSSSGSSSSTEGGSNSWPAWLSWLR